MQSQRRFREMWNFDMPMWLVVDELSGALTDEVFAIIAETGIMPTIRGPLGDYLGRVIRQTRNERAQRLIYKLMMEQTNARKERDKQLE